MRIWRHDNPDVEAHPGEVGEIGGRGGVLMLGYFDDQLVTESSFNRSGWFLSGDLGRLDEAGNLQVVGRRKDAAMRGGHETSAVRTADHARRTPAEAAAARRGGVAVGGGGARITRSDPADP